MRIKNKIVLITMMAVISILPMKGFALAESEKKAIQNQLNQQIINRAFDPDDPNNLKAFLDDAVRKGIRPPLQPPAGWRPGYTCSNIINNGYTVYRNCMLYYRYYGCYYC